MNDFDMKVRSGCTLVFGSLPIKALGSVAKLQRRGAVIDTHVARLAGATLAVGHPSDLAVLAVELAPEARRQVDRAFPGLGAQAREWLAVGQQGQSSQAIFQHTLGVNVPGLRDRDATAHPHELDDLRRCRLLLEAVPEAADRFPSAMPGVSPVWAALVTAWPHLCETMDRETPGWRDGGGGAPETYEAMQEVISGTASTPSP